MSGQAFCEAEFLGRYGDIGANSPTMTIRWDDVGLTVAGRWTWIARSVAFRSRYQWWPWRFATIPATGWARPWGEISAAWVPSKLPRTVILVCPGDDICRVSLRDETDWADLAANIESHGVRLVGRDLPWGFRIRTILLGGTLWWKKPAWE